MVDGRWMYIHLEIQTAALASFLNSCFGVRTEAGMFARCGEGIANFSVGALAAALAVLVHVHRAEVLDTMLLTVLVMDDCRFVLCLLAVHVRAEGGPFFAFSHLLAVGFGIFKVSSSLGLTGRGSRLGGARVFVAVALLHGVRTGSSIEAVVWGLDNLS